MKNILSQIPSRLLGVAFLYWAFGNISDLSVLQYQLGKMTLLPFCLKGASLIFIPGFQLSLGVILISNLKQLDTMRKSATMLAFLFSLAGLLFAIHAALTNTTGCGACDKLAQRDFNLQAWQQAGIYLAALTTSVIDLFIGNRLEEPPARDKQVEQSQSDADQT